MVREALNKGDDEMNHRIKVNAHIFVDVFIAFDEAHTLTNCYDDRKESRFVVLRRALSVISDVPLYSFFLSTTGKITQFGQPRGLDNSDCINHGNLATPRPYIYLGFDQLANNHKVRPSTTLDEVTSLEFVAHLGRPL